MKKCMLYRCLCLDSHQAQGFVSLQSQYSWDRDR